MLEIVATTDWQQNFPGGCVGILEMNLTNPPVSSLALEPRKRTLEADLRERYGALSRPELLTLPVMAAYAAYYKRFKKTYHVLLQMESIIHKGRSLPDVLPLVDAAFMAELETGILTASHDVARLRCSVRIDATTGTEPFTAMNGTARTLTAGDMCMADDDGIVCTIIYGQDNHSSITENTTGALYVAYAPAGIGMERVLDHLEALRQYVLLADPQAVTQQTAVFEAASQ